MNLRTSAVLFGIGSAVLLALALANGLTIPALVFVGSIALAVLAWFRAGKHN